MKSGLEHLPEAKRRELERVVEILFSEFEAAIAGGKAEFKRQGQILKVILFGSYARGDWVDDPVGGYVSDYDLLVVVNDEKLTDVLLSPLLQGLAPRSHCGPLKRTPLNCELARRRRAPKRAELLCPTTIDQPHSAAFILRSQSGVLSVAWSS